MISYSIVGIIKACSLFKHLKEIVMTPEKVTLKNGSTEYKTLVNLYYSMLLDLMERNSGVFGELVKMCREPGYIPITPVIADLKPVFIGHNNQLFSAARNVVLSACIGEGLEIKIHNPLLEEDN